MDFRFRGKTGHAADITAMTESDPRADIAQIEMPQCSGYCLTADFNFMMAGSERYVGAAAH
jgi:hypothetical protein